MLTKVQRAIDRYAMAEPGQRWGVAVSGGPDSIALLEALAESADRLELRLGVVHFNHRWRGEESDQDEAFVDERARALGLPFERAEAAPGRQATENLESAARDARYAFFERLLAAGTFDRIATGHTRSDQAETVLFRVLRGTGLAGLASVRPVRAPGIVRPLIGCSRGEILEWLRERKLDWRDDSSNRELRFSRNRLRHELLPRLAADWNPQVEEALARLGDQAAAEETYWRRIVDEALETLAVGDAAGGIEVDCAAARALDPAVLGRCLDRLAGAIKTPGRQFDAAAFEKLRSMAVPSGPKEAHLPGLVAQRSCDILRLSRPETTRLPLEPVAARPPDELSAPDGRSRVLLRLVEQADENSGFGNADRRLLDWHKLPYPLHLRVWRPGDRIVDSNGGAERPLKEMFRRFQVPVWDRKRWPVLATQEVVVWSRGFGVSPSFAASSATATALEVREIAEDGKEIRGIEDWSRV